MNWYKQAQFRVTDFEDRNLINDRIDSMKKMTVDLVKMAKLVFQTATGTKDQLQKMLDTKRMTTYPAIQRLLEEASGCCLDSPHRFAELCKRAAAQIVLRVNALERERKDFIEKRMPDKWKGWRE